ncbi:MAG: Uma2 family endonuclease [Chloroflexi bacterium]|nr:Uma2 family endonuclease [Chloroflexota bacterium]
MTTREAPVSIEQFEAFLARPENRDRRFELIDGEIIEKPMPTDEHGFIVHVFSGEFYIYFREHPIGRATIEARVRPTGSLGEDRLPDIAVILGDKPVQRRGAVDFIPDICIEVQSPDDSLRLMREKARFYVAHGAKYALVVLPEHRLIELYGSDETEAVFTGDMPLTFGDLLPGFAVPASRFFPATA